MYSSIKLPIKHFIQKRKMETRWYKIVLVGEGAVGKTCFIVTLTHNEFPFDYIPNGLEPCQVKVTVDGKYCGVSLWDTAGQEDYDRIRPLSYPDTDMFLILLPIVHCGEYHTLERIKTKWIPEITHHCPNVPYLIIGTKSDLKDDEEYITKSKEKKLFEILDFEKTSKWALDNGAMKYLECSSMKLQGLQEIFHEIVHSYEKYHKQHKKECILQ